MRVLVTLFCYKLADKRADAGKTDIFFQTNVGVVISLECFRQAGPIANCGIAIKIYIKNYSP